jgi:uncharacterized protein
VNVVRLATAPVKGMRLVAAEALEIDANGARGDRAFCVVDADSRLQLTTRTPKLLQIESSWDGATLTLRFPDGTAVAEEPRLGARATTANYAHREVQGRLVDGALSAAVAEHLGRDVRLFARDPGDRLADDAPVSLMSDASLRALAVADARRFRMTIAIDGAAAWEEHGWGGREIAAGGALLRGIEPVPRCVTTTRDPDSGNADEPVLAMLAELRGKRDVRFGIWCDVLAPGRVRVGDPVAVT